MLFFFLGKTPNAIALSKCIWIISEVTSYFQIWQSKNFKTQTLQTFAHLESVKNIETLGQFRKKKKQNNPNVLLRPYSFGWNKTLYIPMSLLLKSQCKTGVMIVIKILISHEFMFQDTLPLEIITKSSGKLSDLRMLNFPSWRTEVF